MVCKLQAERPLGPEAPQPRIWGASPTLSYLSPVETAFLTYWV